MCGFAGFIDLRRVRAPEAERRVTLQRMGRQLAHRGPDDERIYDDGRLAFVFRRLAIVDVEGGQQPIWNEARTRFVAVNGEIYNHLDLRRELRHAPAFRTRCDSEVVLHLYEEQGPKALDRLIGMFAIVVWDAVEKKLFLARDRLGIKPLYYADQGDLLLFGSELKALLVHPDCPRTPRWSDLEPCRPDAATLDVSAFRAQVTHVEGIHHLPGGSFATYRENDFRRERYWSVDAALARSVVDDGRDDWIERCAELVEDSIEKRLMSDVPVGAFLSGGLDSSLMVTIAARRNRDLHCFHVLERSTYQSGDTAAAEEVARRAGVTLHRVLFDHERLADEIEFSLETLEYFVWLLDSPRFELEWLFKHELHRHARTRIPALKVMLLGQGADEFAGGYSNSYAQEPPIASWAEYLDTLERQREQIARGAAAMNRDVATLLSDEHHMAPPLDRDAAYRDEVLRRVEVLQMHNLWHEDRSAASQGIEARVPFLDHRLVELLVAVPRSRQADLFWDKRILREVARRHLPGSLVARPKIGFFHVRDRSSIESLACDLARRCFPAFRDKYLASPAALFSREKVSQLSEQMEVGGRTGRDAMRLLFTCMVAEIFAAHCRDLASGAMPAPLAAPSPLTEVNGPAPAGWGDQVDRASPDWTDDSHLALEGAVEVLCPVAPDGENELRFVRGDRVEETVALGADMQWLRDLVRLLSDRRPHRFGDLAVRLEVSPSDLADALRFLSTYEWIVPCEAP